MIEKFSDLFQCANRYFFKLFDRAAKSVKCFAIRPFSMVIKCSRVNQQMTCRNGWCLIRPAPDTDPLRFRRQSAQGLDRMLETGCVQIETGFGKPRKDAT